MHLAMFKLPATESKAEVPQQGNQPHMYLYTAQNKCPDSAEFSWCT